LGCNNVLEVNVAPKVNITASVNELTQKEFSRIGGTSELKNVTINDFRKFVLTVDIKNLEIVEKIL
jgi:hypothetical protein